VIGFRLARHHLAERLGADGAQAAAVVGLQDTPPGTAALALAARASVAPEALDELVLVPSVRGAPLAVAERDLGLFTTGLDPPVHQALREWLPPELLWWCRGCESYHVHPSLWRATGIRGVLAIVGREGRSAVFGLPPKAPPLADAGAELARRFLGIYGPSRPKLLAEWAGLATSHAEALLKRSGDHMDVEVDGAKAWALAEDGPALADPPPASGVRLLPNLDPLNGARDHYLLAPAAALRTRIWKALGGPGVVLAGGEVAGLWRPAKKGKRLVVAVESLGEIPQEELAAEAERLAPSGARRAPK